MHCAFFAVAFALASAGNNRPARTAMIAITTSNSIRVNPAHPLNLSTRRLPINERFSPPANRFTGRRSKQDSRWLTKVNGIRSLKLNPISSRVMLFSPESLLFQPPDSAETMNRPPAFFIVLRRCQLTWPR